MRSITDKVNNSPTTNNGKIFAEEFNSIKNELSNTVTQFARKALSSETTDQDQIAIALNNALGKGWLNIDSENWSFNSGTGQLSGPGDYIEYLVKCTKMRIQQDGVYKYVVLTSDSTNDDGFTFVEFVGNTITTATITEVSFSQGNPVDFPSSFDWTPVFGATTGSMTFTLTSISYAKYWVLDKKLFYIIQATGTVGGTPSHGIGHTLPLSPAAYTGIISTCTVFDGGVTKPGSALGYSNWSGVMVGNSGGANFTAGTVVIYTSGFYVL